MAPSFLLAGNAASRQVCVRDFNRESVHDSICKTGKWERVGDLTVSAIMCLNISFQIAHMNIEVQCVYEGREKFLFTLQIA